MFREFLFQEKVEQNYVAPLNCNFFIYGSEPFAGGQVDEGRSEECGDDSKVNKNRRSKSRNPY